MADILESNLVNLVNDLIIQLNELDAERTFIGELGKPVDTDVGAISNRLNQLTSSSINLSVFRAHDYDKLLLECSTLLQRADKDRESWNKYAIENANLSIEVIRLKSRLDILRNQLLDGYYKQTKEESERQLIIQKSKLTEVQDKITSSSNDSTHYEKIRAHDRRQYNKRSWQKGAGAYWGSFRGAEDKKYRANSIISQLNIEKSTQEKIVDNANERFEYEKKAFKYKLKEINAEIEAIELHLRLVRDGILNYINILNPLKERVIDDLAQVEMRKRVCNKGIIQIYGSKIFDNTSKEDGLSNISSLDEQIMWLRQTTNNLSPYVKNKQKTSITVKLDSLRRHGKTPNSLSFEVAEHQWEASELILLPPNAKCVQVKGISLFRWKDLNDPLEIQVSPPSKGKYRRLGEDDILGEISSGVLKCNLSKLSDNTINEIFGIDLLNNVSPIGHWSLHIPTESLRDIKNSYLSIHIEYLVESLI